MIKFVGGEPGEIQTRESGCGCKPCFKRAEDGSRDCLHDPEHVDGWARRLLKLKDGNGPDEDDSDSDDDGEVIQHDAALFMDTIMEGTAGDVVALSVYCPRTQHSNPIWFICLSEAPFKLKEEADDSHTRKLPVGTLVVQGQFYEHTAGSHPSDRMYELRAGVALMAADVEGYSKVIHVGVDMVPKGPGVAHIPRDLHVILSAKIDRDPDDYGDLTRDGDDDSGAVEQAPSPPKRMLVTRAGRVTRARHSYGEL